MPAAEIHREPLWWRLGFAANTNTLRLLGTAIEVERRPRSGDKHNEPNHANVHSKSSHETLTCWVVLTPDDHARTSRPEPGCSRAGGATSKALALEAAELLPETKHVRRCAGRR